MPLWFPSFHHASTEDSGIGFRAFIPNDPVKHRKRTTSEQLAVLEDVFKRDAKPTLALRSNLAAQLNMTPRGVQVWFQNRRAKAKKATQPSTHEHVMEDTHLSSSSCQSVMILSDTGMFSQQRDLLPLTITDLATGPMSINSQNISGEFSPISPWQSSTADESSDVAMFKSGLPSPLLDFYSDECVSGDDIHGVFPTRTRTARVTSLPYPPPHIPREDSHARHRSADATMLSATFQRQREMPGEELQFFRSQIFTPPISSSALPSPNFSSETNSAALTPASVFSDERNSSDDHPMREFTPQSSTSEQFSFGDSSTPYEMNFTPETNSSLSNWESLESVSPEGRRISFSDNVSPDTAVTDMSDVMPYSPMTTGHHAIVETYTLGRPNRTSCHTAFSEHEGITWDQYAFKRHDD